MTYNAAVAAMSDALEIFGEDWHDPTVEDIFVLRPGEFLVRRKGKTERREAPGLDALAVESLGALAGHMRGQYADNDKPILDCELPSGERLNMVLPPVTPAGQPSMALRRAMDELVGLEFLDAQGLFDLIKERQEGLATDYHVERMKHARGLISTKKIVDFFRFCVQMRWSVCFVGETGGGKSTDMKAIINEIPKTLDERIITVGDSEELGMLEHPHKVSFLYSDGGSVTAEDLIKTALRNAPSWLLVQEIRDLSAFSFLRGLIVSPGMTTWHATSVNKAFDALLVMIMQHAAGRAIPIEHLRQMMATLINVVVHVERDPATKKFRATDIKFGSELV